jgi:hypothetical protein
MAMFDYFITQKLEYIRIRRNIIIDEKHAFGSRFFGIFDIIHHSLRFIGPKRPPVHIPDITKTAGHKASPGRFD